MKIRRELREAVLKALYAAEISDESLEDVMTYTLKPIVNGIVKTVDKEQNIDDYDDKEAINFAEKLFLRTINQEKSLDEEIKKQVENWDINRLAIIDKLVLRMAICEMLTFQDIPAKVTINEAIEIAKKYSTAKSGRFVNGILDSTYQTLRDAGKIQKSGRGLIDISTHKINKDS